MASDLNNNMQTKFLNFFSDCIPVLNMKAPVSGWLFAKKLSRTTRGLFMQTESQELGATFVIFLPSTR